VEEIPERLLWGAGVNQFMIRHPELPDVIHNYYLQAAYEAGAAGFLGLLWIFWRLFRSARRFARWAQLTRLREVTAQAEACVFVVLAMALAGMVYPLPHGRLEWLLVLLAWGPGRSRPSGFLGDKLRG
jgi:hypothetical protein